MSENIMTPKFRVSFPDVFRPGKADDMGKQKYGLTMLFEKDADISALMKAAEQAAVDKWGADKSKWPKNLRNPFRDQGDKEYEGYVPGAIFITAKANQRPGLVNARNEDIIEEHEFYAGCYARATVRAFAYDNKSKGVAFGLQNIQKLGDGEPFSGRLKACEEFAPVEPVGATNAEGTKTAADLFG
jgi:hypothetical protein